ncbi:MAG: hypothetical protein ACRCUC_10240, partial [Aestuariivirga sp.]
DAVRAFHTEPDEPEVEEKPAAVEENSEPDDITLEGDEETEGQDDKEVSEPALASDDMVVDIDGEKIPVKDLKSSRLMEKDYTQGKQALAQERTQLRELGTNFQSALDRMGEYLFSKLPPEPDAQLAFTNPNLHYQQKMIHDAALAEMMQVLQVKEGAQEAVNMLSEQDFKALVSAENDILVKNLPHLKEAKRFEAFNRRVETRAKEAGYDDETIKRTASAQLRQVFYESSLYREARANADKAKVKVQEAKPMLPVQRAQHPNSIAALERNNALKRLETTGSIDDAVKAYSALT